jgi:hypothetical protein
MVNIIFMVLLFFCVVPLVLTPLIVPTQTVGQREASVVSRQILAWVQKGYRGISPFQTKAVEVDKRISEDPFCCL